MNGITARNNTAKNWGGVLYTDLYKPTISNEIFTGNTAYYGPNLSAYPIDIRLSLTNSTPQIVSGQKVGDSLNYVAVDFFDQVALNLGNKLAGLQINSREVQLEKQSRASSNNGMFSFENTVIVGEPGTSSVLTFLTSAIDIEKYNAVYGTNLSNYVINTPFTIRF